MRTLRIVGLIGVVSLAAPSAFGVTYPGGSLIIPMQSAYQDYCGVASAYGLVYKVLQANDWLVANGRSRITIHWAYKATKGSPNRCVPTNQNVPPVYGSYTAASPPPWDDPIWNDGCDFRLTDRTSPAVKLVNNLTGNTVDDTIITTINTVGDANVYPNYPSVTIDNRPPAKVTSVGYLGGPFIIMATDASNFLQLLAGTLLAKDASGATIDFGPFRTSAACSFGATTSGHHVNIHRALTSFSGDDNTNFNSAPPRVALLETDSVGGGAVSGGILPNYLTNAGLNFPGAFGCPPGSANATNATLCPAGAKSGIIFDYLDLADISNGALSTVDATGKPIYKAVWTPHWEVGASPAENTAMQNIATFLNQQNGLFAECASIGSYEGDIGTPTVPTNGTQFETCVQDTLQPRQCAATTTTIGTNVNIAPAASGTTVPNCTDPTLATGAKCVYFAAPGDSFAQIGDHVWNDQTGLVANYTPNTGSIYKSGTLPLISRVASLDKTKLSSPAAARAMVVSDVSTRNVKDNAPGKANILYLGGHTFSSIVSGTRIVLGTLLQLGLVYATAETGYQGGTLFNGSAFVPTYERITSTPTSSSVKKYNFGVGSQWIFPYHSGHLRTHLLSGLGALTAGDNAFASAVQWDVKTNMPAPGRRNLFTYLGGSLVTTSSMAQQSGWTPVDFDYTSIQSPVTTCVDKLHVGQVLADATTGRPGPYAGMVPGANGVCDLEEALAANVVLTAGDFGTDQGASEQLAIKTKLLDTSVGGAVQAISHLTQMVRGFCFATSTGTDGNGTLVANPLATQCNYRAQPNINTIGGLVHSQVAVIPASSFIGDAPAGKHRPTVAYVGGLDGQVHAFYVPSDNNDLGYSGPASAVSDLFPSARSTFHNDWLATGTFTPPAALTELWSFIPPGQLGYLYSNDAMVDSSPVVLDVFGDFNNSGIRSWHTVLVASSGGTNRELFALDVTNPLDPVFLWQVQSSYDSTSLPYAPVVLMDNDLGKDLVAGESALQWQNRCRAADVTAGTCTAAKYALPPAADSGRSTSGWYNYRHLGASASVSAAMLRRNNAPVFAAFVATNEPGGQGLYVFAVDLTNGRKIWEFSNPYDKASDPVGMADGIDNTPPPGVTLFSKTGTSLIDTAYAGDLEGSLWELDAADGVSLTSYASQIGASCTAAGSCNFALSNAYGYDTASHPQPITTLASIFTVPGSLPATSGLVDYKGQTLLAYGTAGTDKVGGLTYTVTGSLHLLPLGPTGRYTASNVINTVGLFTTVANKGVAKEVSGYPLYVTAGERLYGSITAAGDHLFFATTSGSVTNIDGRGALGGSTYSLNMTAASASAFTSLATTSGGSAGSVLVDQSVSGQARILTITDQHINIAPPVATNLISPSINGLGQTPTSLLGWLLRSSGREY